jgi:hypothetical protein
MLAHFRQEIPQVRGLIIQLYYGMVDCLFMEVMMAKKDLVICINAALRTRSTNGKKLKAMEFNLLIDLDILQLSSRILCLFLEAGTDTTLWMTFFNIVSSRIIGTKSIEQMDLLLSQDIVTPLLFAEATFTFLVE